MATELNGAVYMEHLIRVQTVTQFLRDLGVDPKKVTEVRVEAGVPVRVFVTERGQDEEREI